nr:hypothetical protein [Candidatus Enterousia merdequi]
MSTNNHSDKIISVGIPEQMHIVQMVHKKPVLLGYKVVVTYEKQGKIDCLFLNGTNKKKHNDADRFYKRILNVQRTQQR